jgi:ribosomal protein S18 acetylase RimI-like enzyme
MKSAIRFIYPIFVCFQRSFAWSTGSTGSPCQRNNVQLTQCSATQGGIIEILSLINDAESIRQAARFMVDAYWLASPHQQPVVNASEHLTASALSSIVKEQTLDFAKTYGERLGSRVLKTRLLAARETDSNNILGLVGMEISLLDRRRNDIVDAATAEAMIKSAVASISPKERRALKDRSVVELVGELLPPGVEAVCCLSNLAVSPRRRGSGIATSLCNKVEDVAKTWEFKRVHLRVESENAPARQLYEKKLGYVLERTIDADAVRLDVEVGAFIRMNVKTLILVKDF